MLCVIFYLLEISRADALGADREKCKAEGHAGQDAKFAILLPTAFAARDAVPRPETRLKTAIFPSWNILFSRPFEFRYRGSFSAHST